MFGRVFSANSSFVESKNRMMPFINAERNKLLRKDKRVANLHIPNVKYPISITTISYIFYIVVGLYAIALVAFFLGNFIGLVL